MIVSGNGAHPHENDAAVLAQNIVVLGGGMQSDWSTNSVIIWDPLTKQWRTGPNLNDKKISLVAVVCWDKVYAMGRYDGGIVLDREHPSVFTAGNRKHECLIQ